MSVVCAITTFHLPDRRVAIVSIDESCRTHCGLNDSVQRRVLDDHLARSDIYAFNGYTFLKVLSKLIYTRCAVVAFLVQSSSFAESYVDVSGGHIMIQ